jgi:sulfur-carrier protein adenylyltransferase/sulfurtransferase
MENDPQITFTPGETERYSRQMAIPSFGPEAQKKLKNARVAVIGAGGLGAPLLQYLAAAGTGTIGIFDFDRVEISNLQRQVLFRPDDVGKKKSVAAGEWIGQINPHIDVNIHDQKITAINAVDLLGGYDIVADGSDNFLTRCVVNDACLILDIPLVYGSIYQFEGQVSVFNSVDRDGDRGPCYRELFPDIPSDGFIPNCAEAGVIGALPGIVGSIQALEVIKVITGTGEPLNGTMLVIDGLSMEFQKMKLPVAKKQKTIDKELVQKRLEELASKYTEEDQYAGCNSNDYVPEITPEVLHRLLKTEEIDLIDVRTTEEHNTFNIGGRLFALDEIEDKASEISNIKKTVLYCESGQRSGDAIRTLKNKHGFENLLNLKGGMIAWKLFIT